MLLGKRPRPPIKRTASMTGITVDPSNVEAQEPTDHPNIQNQNHITNLHAAPQNIGLPAMVSPRNQRRTGSDDFMETAHFLRTCGLCNRPLAPGRDIYMYRGDTAFCSLECREQQMKQDEIKHKCTMTSKKEDHRASPSTSNSKSSTKSETVAAA